MPTDWANMGVNMLLVYDALHVGTTRLLFVTKTLEAIPVYVHGGTLCINLMKCSHKALTTYVAVF